MPIILNIDTSSNVASISISRYGKGIGRIQNDDQKEHASFLQPAIKNLLLSLQLKMTEIDAVAVVNGPGSYTGLRVGMASAKGICYALKKPLITIGSLPLMSKSALISLKKEEKPIPLLCPMIDARRMEVFTTIYNSTFEEIFPAQAIILSYETFVATLLQNKILFFGNGAVKFKELTDHPNALFSSVYDNYDALCELSYLKFLSNQFSDIAYCEPLYLKEFFNG